MRVLNAAGELNPRIADDPRLSRSQVAAVERLGRADDGSTVLGLDGRMRPVVFAKLGGSRGRTRTALLRNGDPAKPELPLAERWP